MRHLGSIVLSVILAPVIYVLAGIAMIRLSTNGGLVAQGHGTNWTDVGIGFGAVVVAGALYAILTMVRLSPLGPVIASLLFIGVQLWSLFAESNLEKTLGTSVLGNQDAVEAPLTGVALLLAVPLLVTIFSPRRWRGQDKPVSADGGYPQPNYAGPSYPTPSSAAPDYSPLPESTTPDQTTPETAADASADEPTEVENRPGSTN